MPALLMPCHMHTSQSAPPISSLLPLTNTYPTSLPPHPACTRMQGATAVVRTLGPLPAGAPLLHCYGPQQGEMSWAQRQQALRQQYCFDCGCAACAGGPSALDLALVGLRCQACSSSGGGDSGSGGSRQGSGGAGHSAAVPVAASPCQPSGDMGGASSSEADAVGAACPPGSVAAGLVSRYALEPSPGRPASSAGCSRCGAELRRTEWERRLLPRLQRAAELQAQAEELLAAAEPAAGRVGEGAGSDAAAGAAPGQAVRLLQECLQVGGWVRTAALPVSWPTP